MKKSFYKYSKTLFGRLIVWKQQRMWLPERYARYSHEETVLEYEEVKEILAHIEIFDENNKKIETLNEKIEKVKIYGLWISSSEMDGWVRAKTIDDSNGNWDFIHIEVESLELQIILNFLTWELWNKYNKVGIFFAQIFNFNFKKKGQWFCSEIGSYALQTIWMLCVYDSLFMTPWEEAMRLEDAGYKLTVS